MSCSKIIDPGQNSTWVRIYHAGKTDVNPYQIIILEDEYNTNGLDQLSAVDPHNYRTSAVEEKPVFHNWNKLSQPIGTAACAGANELGF
jgi:hypothetical protein